MVGQRSGEACYTGSWFIDLNVGWNLQNIQTKLSANNTTNLSQVVPHKWRQEVRFEKDHNLVKINQGDRARLSVIKLLERLECVLFVEVLKGEIIKMERIRDMLVHGART